MCPKHLLCFCSIQVVTKELFETKYVLEQRIAVLDIKVCCVCLYVCVCVCVCVCGITTKGGFLLDSKHG